MAGPTSHHDAHGQPDGTGAARWHRCVLRWRPHAAVAACVRPLVGAIPRRHHTVRRHVRFPSERGWRRTAQTGPHSRAGDTPTGSRFSAPEYRRRFRPCSRWAAFLALAIGRATVRLLPTRHSVFSIDTAGLLRTPDALSEVLVMARDDQAQLTGHGWSRRPRCVGPYRWMTAAQGRLLLPIAGPAPRAIRIQAMAREPRCGGDGASAGESNGVARAGPPCRLEHVRVALPPGFHGGGDKRGRRDRGGTTRPGRQRRAREGCRQRGPGDARGPLRLRGSTRPGCAGRNIVHQAQIPNGDTVGSRGRSPGRRRNGWSPA